LHRGAGDEDRSFERIGPPAGELIGDGGEQPMPRTHRHGPGVEEREAAGAVGGLHHALHEAALTDGRRLLIAGNAADADRAAEQAGLGQPEIGGAVANLGQHSGRHPEQFPHLPVPRAAGDIEQQRPRSVGGIGGVNPAAGKPPQQKRVDRPERQPAGCGGVARAENVVQQPGDFGRGKIRVEDQSGCGGDGCFVARRAANGAGVGRAPVLPDDRIVDRLAGRAIPHDRGLALVGDADPGDIARGEASLGHRFAHGCQHRRPDFLGVVFDGSRGRIDLPQLLLRHGHRAESGVEHDRPRRCGSLVDGDEVTGHGRRCCRLSAGSGRGSLSRAGELPDGTAHVDQRWTYMIEPVPSRKKNKAFGIVSERLQRFYAALEDMIDPNTDDFFQRVMKQMERDPRAAAKRGQAPFAS
jgi:hypothetical protein